MQHKKLTLKDKSLFDRFFKTTEHELSVYAFENIYIWKALFDIKWTIIGENLCVFFKDKIGCFLYLPPLGQNVNRHVIEAAFKVMDACNKNKEVSRIENVEEGQLQLYRSLGYTSRHKSDDYICRRKDIVLLRGNLFKSKRASINRFIKHYSFRYMPFSLSNRRECLKLYDLWARSRSAGNPNSLYKGMIWDSRECLRLLFNNYRHLDYKGRIVKIGNAIKAFTFGFELNPDTFCVLYEITDLSVNGLAQYIFREFCHELEGYAYINIMDDSGLENLRKVKLSYRPRHLAPSYIVER